MTPSGLLADTATRTRLRAYGVELACEFALPGVPPASPDSPPAARAIRVRSLAPGALGVLWSGPAARLHEAALDGGVSLVVERGRGGDHLIRHGEHRFHLAADGRTMSCAPALPADPGWRRALLDWAAYAAATLGGADCLHASAVELDGGAVAIAAAAGAGKTTLALELVGQGASFLTDDVLALALRAGAVRAEPGPPFAAIGSAWVEMERAATGPLPVSALILLDRAGDKGAPTLAPARFADLRRLAIGFPQPREAEERRLALLAALAAQAPVLQLRAASATTPKALAGFLLSELAGERR